MKNINDEDLGLLIIHRDLPGDHTDGIDCWCEPFIIEEDTLLTPEQIVEKVSIKKYVN